MYTQPPCTADIVKSPPASSLDTYYSPCTITGPAISPAGSLDTKVKIWDVYEKGRPVKQTYLGHSGAVRQVNFNNDGSRYVMTSTSISGGSIMPTAHANA